MKLYSTPLRRGLSDVLSHVSEELLIASPFIKISEANWMTSEFSRERCDSIKLNVLTDVRSENVLNGSLDIHALDFLIAQFSQSVLVNLPRLHAKVYIADNVFALVTSANLTSPGMQSNFDYGVGIDDEKMVRKIRSDLLAYAELGNVLSHQTLLDLIKTADNICKEYKRVEHSAETKLKREFKEKLQLANHAFLKAQVGNRSAQSLFVDAIIFMLSQGPLATKELHPRIQQLLPDLCDDSVELVINGDHFGKRWKHAVRNAQQFLKRTNKIQFDGKVWSLAR